MPQIEPPHFTLLVILTILFNRQNCKLAISPQPDENKKIFATLGQSLNITCCTIDQASLTWTYDKTEMTAPPELLSGDNTNQSLFFKAFNTEHLVEYTCADEKENKSIILKAYSPSVEFVKGVSFQRLSCVPGEHIDPDLDNSLENDNKTDLEEEEEFDWWKIDTKSGKFVELLESERFTYQHNTSSLLILSPTESDGGVYSAKSNLSECRLQYLAGPQIQGGEEEICTKNEGEILYIDCSVEGYPSGVVKWTLDDRPLILHQHDNMVLRNGKNGFINTSLQITNVLDRDSGVYVCAIDYKGDVYSSKRVVVNVFGNSFKQEASESVLLLSVFGHLLLGILLSFFFIGMFVLGYFLKKFDIELFGSSQNSVQVVDDEYCIEIINL